MSGVTKPHDHHWAKEESKLRDQLLPERAGKEKSQPKALQEMMESNARPHQVRIHFPATAGRSDIARAN